MSEDRAMQEKVERSLDERRLEIARRIVAGIEARRNDGPDLKDAHLALIDGLADELEADDIAGWKQEVAAQWDRVNAQIEEKVVQIAGRRKPTFARRGFGSNPVEQKPVNDVRPPETEATSNAYEKLRAKIGFHQSDHAPNRKLPTVEEKQRRLDELADLWDSDPLAYANGRKQCAEEFCTTVVAIDRAVKIVRDKRTDDGEQSQTTKLVAIGVGDGVELWHAPDGFGYATIWINGHWENHRLEHTSFGQWLRAEYGRLNVCKVGDQFIPQASGAQALRDAVATLEGIAKFKREERPQPALRVGGDTKTIWLDLGGADWSAVEVSAEGWWPRDRAGVSFLRTDQILPLPKPERGGSIKALQGVLNIRPGEFVLAVAWLLQALNPIGSYPIIDADGPSEAGKTATCKKLLQTIHPTKTELRKAKKVDDLLIAARNDWALGFDNMSYMSGDWSDTLCMLSTGVSSGTRRHYTNDEEHVFTVKRPVLFNGIPTDLTRRPDLASRVIKLGIPPIKRRRTDLDLEEDFKRVWPEVLGALLDGLVGALRDWRKIDVEQGRGLRPARLMDFEKSAEAGCRAMGFREWEFVDAYYANRNGMMIAAVEASAVGRVVTTFIEKNPEGFAGQMTVLYNKLESYKPANLTIHDWPKTPSKLSTELRRLMQPLEAIGIVCAVEVDRRDVGGTQVDVVLAKDRKNRGKKV